MAPRSKKIIMQVNDEIIITKCKGGYHVMTRVVAPGSDIASHDQFIAENLNQVVKIIELFTEEKILRTIVAGECV